ncbi:hypothetical protein [Actinomadura rupiterrae]|uniref:hypothetical protein n=1 Tax=Actinomadura rupiterrae TaxID=559627 RepID=UPI0020A5F45D|nr:hypothetical protein [Actinomadura rupiterrae]MCP2337548.1 hypothetical protein [Actinomadura rupiterrae]
MEELEADLIAEDLADAGSAQAVEHARRRLADHQYVLKMQAENFAGPATAVWKAETAAYGLAVMMAWTRTGKIVAECRAKRRPITLVEVGPGRWSRDDRLELACETVAKALEYFITAVLVPGRWDHRKGASLKTYFVGACLFQFPNIYNAWAGHQDRWRRVAEVTDDPQKAEETLNLFGPRGHDPTSSEAMLQVLRHHALELITDPVTRQAVRLIMQGEEISQAALSVGLKDKTLRTRLDRLKGLGQTTAPKEAEAR